MIGPSHDRALPWVVQKKPGRVMTGAFDEATMCTAILLSVVDDQGVSHDRVRIDFVVLLQ